MGEPGREKVLRLKVRDERKVGCNVRQDGKKMDGGWQNNRGFVFLTGFKQPSGVSDNIYSGQSLICL